MPATRPAPGDDDFTFPPDTFGPPPFVLVLSELPFALFVRPVLLAPCKAELPAGQGEPIHVNGSDDLSLDHHNRLVYRGHRPSWSASSHPMAAGSPSRNRNHRAHRA